MVLVKNWANKLTVSGEEGDSGTGGTGTSGTTNTVDVVLRVVGVIIVEHMSNVAHIFWKGGFVSKQSISGFMRSMAMKDPFSVVQDLMHHCSLDGMETSSMETRKLIHGMVVQSCGNLGKCSFNSSKTMLCERKTSTLLRVCHTKSWRMEVRQKSLLLCCTVSPRAFWETIWQRTPGRGI